MKFILPILTLVSVQALAAPNFCDRMPCATYQGVRGGTTDVTTTIVISAIDDTHGRFLYTLSAQGEQDEVWDLNVEFAQDGGFRLTTQKGYAYANGICEDRICTYGMHPFPNKDGKTWGNAGILQFKDDGLDFLMTVGFPTDNHQYLTQLTKK